AGLKERKVSRPPPSTHSPPIKSFLRAANQSSKVPGTSTGFPETIWLSSALKSGTIFPHGDHFHFDRDIPWQRSNSNRGAGGFVFGEIVGVHGIVSREVLHIEQVYVHFQDLIERASGIFQDAFDIFEGPASFGRDVVAELVPLTVFSQTR